ncbi:MAG: ParB/Srx family N-terminal domain-containing protein [Proteobacteria bacterium]|nr:ParB/Srx family N-terminal domain-containing protein [Pseudomonadota bacterium]
MHHHHLASEAPERLRPTQMSVGLVEVARKRREWAALGRKQRRETLQQQVFPAVLGPGQRYFIIDHHHLGLALIREKVDRVWIALQDDLSWLEPEVFWRTMEFRAWAHPFDANGKRRDFRDMPRRLTDLDDDPYRSLAGDVHKAGGYAKSNAPFAEFLWADFLRARIGARALRRQPHRAVRAAVKLAKSADARYLPGWSGADS